MLLDLTLLLLSFLAIWFGAGLIISSIEDLSHKLNISAFATSFFILGILTSIPEFSVGINSIIDHDPEIFIGTLIGASLVLFLFVIPILAVLGNGIVLSHQLDGRKLPLTLFVVTAPSFLIVDRKVTPVEGLFLVILYFVLFYIIEKRKGFLERVRDRIIDGKTHILKDLLKILGGSIIVFLFSKVVVDQTILLSELFHVSPFLMSLLVLSLGTNLPELSLAIRSVTFGKKEVALGDYVGSAAANTLIFGLLTIINQKEIILDNHFFITFIFMIFGLVLFFYFTRSKNDISRQEGLCLLLYYFTFIFLEIIL